MIAYFVLTDSSSFFQDCNPALVQGNFSWYKLRADLKAKEITIQTRVFFSMSECLVQKTETRKYLKPGNLPCV